MSIEKDFDKILAKAIPANTNIKTIKITGIWIVIGLMVAFFSPHNSTNNGNVGIGNQIIINNNQPLKNWRDLNREEKEDLKTQAIVKFPEIKDMGSGIDWRPVTEWLTSQGVQANSTRDLFRSQN